MRQYPAVALAFICLLCSCRPASRAYLVADAATLALLGGERSARAMCKAGAAGLDIEPKVLSSAEERDVTATLEQALADPACRLVVVASAAAVDVRQQALDRADVLFAAYGEPSPSSPANFLLLTAGRPDAFREAGERIGTIVAEAGEGAKVGILTVTPTVGAQEEIEAFREGVGESAPGGVVLAREARSNSDKAAAVRLLGEMRTDGADFFLLKAYGLTVACLEDLARSGGKAVVEDCGGGCGGEVVFSIETDWGKMLASVFGAADPATWSWRTTTLSEPWRLEENDDGQ